MNGFSHSAIHLHQKRIDEMANDKKAINESELEKVVGGCAPSENDQGIPTGEIIIG